MIAALFLCTVAAVTDGDTLRCTDSTRVRLAGIDAPELHACPRTRTCAPGDAQASKRALERLATGTLQCRHVGWSYRRRVAWCEAGGVIEERQDG